MSKPTEVYIQQETGFYHHRLTLSIDETICGNTLKDAQKEYSQTGELNWYYEHEREDVVDCWCVS